MGVINDILGVVDTAVEAVAADGFAQSAGAVGGVITAGSILLVILLGINVVTQIRPMSFASFFAFGIKIVLVGIFAQSWANFQVVYNIVTDVPESIGSSILRLTGSGTESGLYQSLDSMVARVTAYGDSIGDNAGWVFGAVLGGLVFLVAGFFAAIAAGIIAFSKIVFTLMIVLAPFAIVCSLFKPTLPVFEAWTRSLIGYALMPVAAAGAAGIIVAIAQTIASDGPNPDNVDTLSLIFPFIVVLILAGGIMAAVPSIAMGLSGAIGLAANVAGMNNLAKMGVVTGGSAGTRISTGHSPRAIREGVNAGLERVGKEVTQGIRNSPAKILAVTKSLRSK